MAQNAVSMGKLRSRPAHPIVGTTSRMPSTRKPKLKCFVAMAFEQPDTERWFDNVLRPLLRVVNAEGRRVDRIEHNDDIDDRILAEIAQADFMVADLTYARPSVYFEAGYAQRVIPVIYTSRADHIGAPTTSANRVHFDLQMKNIVSWREPPDDRFRKRMESRLRSVVAPLLRRKLKETEAAEQAARFGSLSQAHQLDIATDALEGAARKSRLTEPKDWKTSKGLLRMISPPVLPLRTGTHKGWIRLLRYSVAPSFQQTFLRGIRADVNLGRYGFEIASSPKEIRGVAELVVLVSLNSVPLERIRSTFPSWQVKTVDPKQLEWDGTESIRRHANALDRPGQARRVRSERLSIPWRSRLVIVDAVRSEELLKRRLTQAVKGFEELEDAT